MLGREWADGQGAANLGARVMLMQAPGPRDGIGSLRRMVKWVVDENGDGDMLEAQAIAKAAE